MSTYRLPPREISLDDSWDVIVVGGGPAGCTAAAAAAREGSKTLLIEATCTLGGMGTAGLVPAWCPFSDKQEIIYRGLAEKVFTACKESMSHVDNAALDWCTSGGLPLMKRPCCSWREPIRVSADLPCSRERSRCRAGRSDRLPRQTSY